MMKYNVQKNSLQICSRLCLLFLTVSYSCSNSEKNAYEIPLSPSSSSTMLLKRHSYTTAYNKVTRNPEWVGWCLTAEHTEMKGLKYTKFLEDTDVPQPRANYSDIRESVCGYQRGHMCPSADSKWSYKAQIDASLMTNICPQNGDLNQRDWKTLECKCRDWAREYGAIWITCGPIFYTTDYKTVGEHEIAVPDAFFKVVMTFKDDMPQALGFIYQNTAGHRKIYEYAVSVDSVETITGLDFFHQLPDDIETQIESECCLDRW